MKIYLGSKTSLFCGVMLIIFCVGLLFLGFFFLVQEISFPTILLSIWSFGALIIELLYLKKFSKKLFCWGIFSEEEVQVFLFFRKIDTIKYEQCIDIGIAGYAHGYTNHSIGIKQLFIYLSYRYLPNKYKSNVNLVPIFPGLVLIRYDRIIANYLLQYLPAKQKKMLDHQLHTLNFKK